MALSKVQSSNINLADNFAFTGTVTGAGKIVAMGEISQPTNGVTNGASASYVDIISNTQITPVKTNSTFLFVVTVMNGVHNGSANYFAWCRFRVNGIGGGGVLAGREFHGGGYMGNNNRASHRGAQTCKYQQTSGAAFNVELTGATYDNNNITEFGGWNQDTGWNDKCTIAYWEMAD